MRRRSLLLVAGLSLITLAVVIGLLLRRPPRIAVTTAAVTSGTIARQIIATGTLTPSKTVETGSQVSGTVKSLDADFNSVVRAGQVVMRLDPAVYEAQLDGARGKLAQAQAEWQQLKVVADDAGVKLARAEQLHAQALIPDAEFDAAKVAKEHADADLRGKAADIKGAQALVDQARVNLEHTIIRSPIDGVVVARMVDVGQTITATVQSPVLFDIADLRHMQLLAAISEGDVGGLRPGSRASFQVESLGDRRFEGVVSEVRLQPVVEQPTSTTGSTTAGTTSGTATTSSSAGRTSASATTASPAQATSPQPAGTPQSTASLVATAPATSGPNRGAGVSGVVSYTAVVDVDNRDGMLTPGGTALITLAGAERHDVVRIPNNALTFRPTANMLEAIGQEPPDLERGPAVTDQDRKPGVKAAYVWRFDGKRFVPIEVLTGLADERWTELVGGNVHPGELLVTNAKPL
jgi:RND family efflux transporter MFP subunit